MIDVGKGDSHVVELRDESGDSRVIVIDGGAAANSEPLLNHVSQYHDNGVDIVVSTHPDTDHIGGLVSLLENHNVAHLILNDPRGVISEPLLLKKARTALTSDEYSVFTSAFERMDALQSAAQAQGTSVHTLFASPDSIYDWGGWSVYVLGPSEGLFRDIWLNDEVVSAWFHSDTTDAAVAAIPGTSIIDDPSIDTKPVNNSSIIILIEGHGRKYLFTGDAGKRALRGAMTVKDISKLNWLDVPHHGSRRNLDRALITHLAPEVAYISSPGTTKHPRRAVVRALQKAGAMVYSTCRHGSVYNHYNLPRDGWSPISPWELIP